MTNLIKIWSIIALWVLAVLPATMAKKMDIRVYAGLYAGADRWSMKFSTTQKCYTFSSCLNDNSVGADWESIDNSLAIVFYEKEQCQGTKLISHTVPKGQLMFTFDKGAKSFMVWSQGMYATNGIEYRCLERTDVNTTNTTDSSGSSLGSEDIVLP